MEFKPLTTTTQVDDIKGAEGSILIFKHNTTCSISKGVRAQFEEEADTIPNVQSVYFLDLLAHRDVSDHIARQFGIPHESPQLLLIRDGKCIYHKSLYDISAESAAEAAA